MVPADGAGDEGARRSSSPSVGGRVSQASPHTGQKPSYPIFASQPGARGSHTCPFGQFLSWDTAVSTDAVAAIHVRTSGAAKSEAERSTSAAGPPDGRTTDSTEMRPGLLEGAGYS